jgi:hypothetical protein
VNEVTDIARMMETRALASIEARHVVAATRDRVLRTESGRIVSQRELVDTLVKRADLEEATVGKKRPPVVRCQDCSRPMRVGERGRAPERCKPCKRKRETALLHERRQTKPKEKRKLTPEQLNALAVKRREQYKADPEKHRAASAKRMRDTRARRRSEAT